MKAVSASLTMTYREFIAEVGLSEREFYRLKAAGRFDDLKAPIPHRFSRKRVEEFINGKDRSSLRRVS